MAAIVDSHIHLYLSSDINALAWASKLRENHVLNRGYSVKDYRSAIAATSATLQGFIFIETDRRSGLTDSMWNHALDEVSYIARIAKGEPLTAEAVDGFEKELCLGIIPWAPVPMGPEALDRYMALVTDRCSQQKIWNKVKGVRYLLQDKELGTMLHPDFIEGLKWLGRNNLTFDLGVDARSGGLHQLREACELMLRIYDNVSYPTIIINHMCKPNFFLSVPEIRGGHPEFVEWRECVEKMASFPATYMKLSGGLSELPPQEPGKPGDIDELVFHLQPWMDVIFKAFTPSRIMFGSDWPVCNVGGPGVDMSWQYWHDLVSAILAAQNLTDRERAMAWSGTARKAYNIS